MYIYIYIFVTPTIIHTYMYIFIYIRHANNKIGIQLTLILSSYSTFFPAVIVNIKVLWWVYIHYVAISGVVYVHQLATTILKQALTETKTTGSISQCVTCYCSCFCSRRRCCIWRIEKSSETEWHSFFSYPRGGSPVPIVWP